MKKNKLNIILAVVLAICVAVGGYLYMKSHLSVGKGDKTIQLTVVDGKGDDKVIKIGTKADTLGEALKETKIVSGEEGEMGIFVDTVSGIKADSSLEQWWCFQKDGKTLTVGIDQVVIQDGEEYTAVLKTGYDSF